jgi:broad specificity phosphatase PhoE
VNDDDNLREIYLGKWECRPIDELKQDEYFINGWTKNFGTCTPPEGESVKDAGERVYNAVLEIARKNEGKNILITAHAAVIRSLWGIVSEIAFEDLADAVPFPTNASVTTIFFEEGRLIPGTYSDDSHLAK